MFGLIIALFLLWLVSKWHRASDIRYVKNLRKQEAIEDKEYQRKVRNGYFTT